MTNAKNAEPTQEESLETTLRVGIACATDGRVALNAAWNVTRAELARLRAVAGYEGEAERLELATLSLESAMHAARVAARLLGAK